MRRFFNVTGHIALEEEKYQPEPVAEQTPTEDELDLDQEDIQSLLVGVNNNSTELANAVAAVTALEELSDILENSDSDVMTPETSAISNVVIDQAYDKMNIEKPDSISLEEDTDKPSVVARIRENVVRILQAIAEVFKQAMQYLTTFAEKLTNAAGRLEKYAFEVRSKIAKMESTSTAKTIDNKSLAKKVGYEGSLIKRAIETQELVSDSARVALGDHVQYINKVFDEYSKDGDVDKMADAFPGILNRVYGSIFKHGDDRFEWVSSYPKDKVDMFTSDYLVGDFVAAILIPKDVENLSYLKFNIARPDDEESKESIPAASKDELTKIIRVVIDITSTIRAFRTTQKKIGEFGEKLNREITRLKNVKDENLSEKNIKLLKAIGKMAPFIAKGIHESCFSFGLSSSRVLLEYCEASIKAHEKTE